MKSHSRKKEMKDLTTKQSNALNSLDAPYKEILAHGLRSQFQQYFSLSKIMYEVENYEGLDIPTKIEFVLKELDLLITLAEELDLELFNEICMTRKFIKEQHPYWHSYYK